MPSRRTGSGQAATMGAQRLWLEQLIFGGEASRRFTQDSPVLPDVWIQYGRLHLDPDRERERTGEASDAVDLLMTPHRATTVPELSGILRKRLSRSVREAEPPSAPARGKRKAPGIPRTFWDEALGRRPSAPEVAYNQATVVARLTLQQLVLQALPLSQWWSDTVRIRQAGQNVDLATETIESEPPWNRSLLESYLRRVSIDNGDRSAGPRGRTREALAVPSRYQVFVWLVRLLGTLALVKYEVDEAGRSAEEMMAELPGRHAETVEAFLSLIRWSPAEIVVGGGQEPILWTVSLNRTVRSSIEKSVLTVKADAARKVFNIDTGKLAWAVLDSGIDAAHPAFRSRRGSKDGAARSEAQRSRVRETYDFTRVRSLLASSTSGVPPAEDDPEASEVNRRRLRRRLNRGQALDWSILRDLLRLPDGPLQATQHDHGTHVAGILAGDWHAGDDPPPPGGGDLIGVAPTLMLYDLRVLDENGLGSEFSVLAALQFVRWLNTQYDEPRIHGVNLSLSMKHDVANYACGRTPVCEECERVSSSGVVVVAAAGNDGYQKFTTPTGDAEGYRSISISDPGNAESVITVGATHRNHPHSYGVSYFSSRGPTGDGRCKPDLVAPGEKITAPTPGGGAATKDGTSMAAPHVSGAAALLMARHRELQGHPQRIKEILCSTATDLKREPYFQGRGLVDILRALQSV